MTNERVFAMKFAKVYPLYVQKAERKNRTKEEVDRIICWLTGYSQAELQRQIALEHDFKIGGKVTPKLKPGKTASLTVTLKKGKASYLCTIPGHAAAGMKGVITVK